MLTDEQKKQLLIIYFGGILSDFDINNLEQQLNAANISYRWSSDKTGSSYLAKWFEKLIYKMIPASELNTFLYAAITQLNKQSNPEMIKEKNVEEVQSTLLLGLQFFMEDFHEKELQTAKSKALKDTLLFCMFIVTIPFATWFYKSRKDKYKSNCYFEKIFVSDALLERPATSSPQSNSTNKINRSLDSHDRYSPKNYGLFGKWADQQEKHLQVNIEEAAFNKHKEVRKISHNYFHDDGIIIFGNRKQINKTKAKLNPPRDYDYDPEHHIKYVC